MESFNYFLDCGSHHGEGLQEFLDKGIINETFKVACFEPNPLSFQTLSENRKLLDRFNKTDLINKAVWDSNSVMRFRMEHYAPLSSKYDGTGSTLLPEDLWHPGVGVYDRDVYVETIDFDEFLQNLHSSCAYTPNIVVKMDIEGAEFTVLEKLIKTGSIRKVSKLFVEFHAWAINEDYENRQRHIITDLNNLSVPWEMWK